MPVLGHCHEAGEQLAVDAPRRVDVDDGEKAGLVQKISSLTAPRQSDQFKRVLDPIPSDGAGIPDPICERDLRSVEVQMPRFGWKVHGLYRHGAGEMQHVQALMQLNQIALVFVRAGSTATIEIGHIWRACDGREIDRAPAHDDIPIGVAGK